MQEQSEALADSNRRKDEFLAILSHELRNPLASILNAVQIFHLSKGIDPLQLKAKTIVERQVGQLILMVDDLLEVTRISTGAVVVRLERCEVGEILRRAVEAMAHSLAKQGHALSVTIPPTPIWLDADPGRIEQVMTNLLGNAIKYTDPGGRIEVSVQLEKDSGLRTRDSKGTLSPLRLGGRGPDRTRVSVSRRNCSRGSSSCSRRRIGRWPARKADWASG